MRKLLFMILLFIPLFVYADNCNANDIVISNIHLIDNTDGVVEVSDAGINGNDINVNLKMKNLNDEAKYQLTISNNSNEDYEISGNSFIKGLNYITYDLATVSNTNVIKAKTSEDVLLMVKYANEIPQTLFTNDSYSESNTLTINLSSENNSIIPNEIVNPKTGYTSYVFIFIMCIFGFSLIYIIINKSKFSKYFVLFILLIIPFSIKAICKTSINVVSNIEIEKPVISYLMKGTHTPSDTVFLRTNILKRDIEKITFANSLGNHVVDDPNCFDVSRDEDGSVLAWVSDEDGNGKYEMKIGANGKVYVSSGYYLFSYLTEIKSFEGLKNLDTSYNTNMGSMFGWCEKLTTFDFSYFNTSNVSSMADLFYGCEELTSLDLSSFDTSNVTLMKEMFTGCKKLVTLDLSNFNTSKVTRMDSMFYLCLNMESLNISSFDTSKVTDMDSMFSYCQKLSTLDLRNFDTSNVAYMRNMFQNSIINNLDISSFNTSKVIYMSDMFAGFSGMDSLDLSNFKTTSLIGISEMFKGSKFVSIDLSNFDTSAVTNVREMFRNCNNLETIYASDKFVTIGVTVASSANNMFYGCTKLVGGEGTTYNSSHVDTLYAHIDEGPSNPGYFTLKIN